MIKGDETVKTYAVVNQKGGVGKSTTALALGAGFRRKGYSVLFVDLDAQGNLSYALGADTKGDGVLGVLQRPETVKNELQHTAEGDVIASSPALAGADAIITATGKEYRLREALEELQGDYDYCVIDTPPALGILNVNALTVADKALIPAQADVFSLQGISQLHSTIETVKKYCNRNLSISGIVLTRYSARSIISREVAEMIEETAHQLKTKLYKAKVREGTAIKEAQAVKQNIFDYAPKSNVAADYEALIEEILGDE